MSRTVRSLFLPHVDLTKTRDVTITLTGSTANSSYRACGKKIKVTLPSKSVVMLALDPQ